MEGLPKSDGFSVILVVVDCLTKYAHFFPLKHPFSALSVARVLFDGVVKLHGLPNTMVFDRDKIFTSSVWTELFKLVGIQLLFSTTYHPQTDGVNQCLEMYLRCAVSDAPKKWHAWLAQAEFWYNTNFLTAIGCSPFKALYGYDPDLGVSSSMSSSTQPLVSEFMQDRATHLDILKEQLHRAQNRMKQAADRHRSEVVFQVGDKVLMKLQPYA